jgi:hypothetical protein
MIRFYLFLTILLVFYSNNQAQIIKKHEIVRLGFGVSKMIDSDFNSLIDDVDNLSGQIGPELNMTRFTGHITFFLEYENEISDRWSYLARFQYHSDAATGSNYDQDSKIEQGMNHEFNLYEAGLELIYYIPFIQIGKSNTSLIAAAGASLAYTEISTYYFFDQRPAYLQVTETNRNSMLIGGRVFSGINIPFVESLNFQLRFGVSIYPSKEIPGEVSDLAYDESGKAEGAMNSQVFSENNQYNFSQLWITFNIGYRF